MPHIGIDPGLNGAVAVLLDDGEVVIRDMPTIQDGTKKRLDYAALADIFDNLAKLRGVRVTIEKVHALPRDGSAGAFSFGQSYGIAIGLVAAHFMPLDFVTPQQWKKAMRCPTDKDGARLRASSLFPQHSHHWPLKKHDGRAEALLIAHYGQTRGLKDAA
jgi:crossover junction endodeoxyribonuclease RuvC